MVLFRDQGYAATSIRDLVDRMGINRFSLYATFRSKHDLFVDALQAYDERVAVPFFDRLRESGQGLAIIESVLLELVTRVTRGVSANGCLLCNSIAEIGARADTRTTRILGGYLRRVEMNFRSAVERAIELGEISVDVDAAAQGKVLAAYSTGLVSMSKVMTEREMRQSVRSVVKAIDQ